MEQTDRHFSSRLDFDRERFETDEVYRRDLMEQQREFETRRLDLVEEENEFRRTFDQERFESDEQYRRETLAHQKSIDNRRADLAAEQVGLDRERLSSQEYSAFRNDWNNGYAAYQAAKASCMNNPNMDAAARQGCVDSAEADWTDSPRESDGSFQPHDRNT